MNSDDSSAKEKRNSEDDHVESKAFVLLNELSDLLMLPKDMLMEIYIREEVCLRYISQLPFVYRLSPSYSRASSSSVFDLLVLRTDMPINYSSTHQKNTLQLHS